MFTQPQLTPPGEVQSQVEMPPPPAGLWQSSPPQPPAMQSASVWQLSLLLRTHWPLAGVRDSLGSTQEQMSQPFASFLKPYSQ